MLLLIAVVFLVLLMFLFAWFFFRKAFYHPTSKDLNEEEVLLTSEWFSYSPVLKPSLEWFRKQPWEELSISAHDGISLQGLWLPRSGAKACLLLMHGYEALPQNLCVIARWAAKKGWALLLPYERAHGKSGGKYCSLGLLEAEDCRLWAAKAEELCGDGVKLVMLGSGMGGFAVLHSLSKPLPESVCAVIADGAYSSPRGMLRYEMKERLRMRVFPLLQIVCLYGGLIWKAWPGSADLTDALKAEQKLPILFIHGKQDQRVPCSMTEEMSKACQGKKRLYISENAGHGASCLSDSDAYFRQLKQFLDPLI